MSIRSFAAILFAIVFTPTFSRGAEIPFTPFAGELVHPTRLIARFSSGIDPADRAASLAALGEVTARTYSIAPRVVVLEPQATAAAMTGRHAGNRAAALKARMTALRATGWFDYVEPDHVVRGFAAPTDAAFVDGTLWGLNNFGQSGGVSGADIGATNAWELTTGSTDVIVAVIDSGVRHTHQDLAAQMWVNPGEIPGNGIDDDGDGYVDNVHGINAITGSGDSRDDNDHGTHVAGIIGAAANDGHPHVGVAWQVRLMACKFLDANGSGLVSDAIECIDFAVANGARILNNSWGGTEYSQGLVDAIAAARDQEVLFVAAAGNDGSNNDVNPVYPASHSLENIVTVTALDRSDSLANFSNYGANSVHLGAPGVAIFSCSSGADDAYGFVDGTSAATPHVSGVAALVLARHPGIPLSELRQRVTQSAVPVPALNGITLTGGRVNAFNALEVAEDDVLEVVVTTPQGNLLAAGSTVPVFVQVTDLSDVTNATVTGSTADEPLISFLNDGVAPDQVAGDAVYSAHITAPASGSQFTLTLVSSAPGKQTGTNTVDFFLIQPPPNDAFADAVVIAGTGGTFNGSNVSATAQSLEPIHCDTGGRRTVWWTWTAPQDQVTTVSTLGSDFDTVLAVYTGPAVNDLTPVTCNDDAPGRFLTSEVIFAAAAGTTYHIAVDGSAGTAGNVVLTLSENPPLPNDDFANRAPISGLNHTIRSSNFGAGVEDGEPLHCGDNGGASVWWSWTAASSGLVYVSTAGSSFDTVLAVYTGGDLANLDEVACNDERQFEGAMISEMAFVATAGTTYQVAVDGWFDGVSADVGNIVLNIVAPPANDNFAGALALTGGFAEAQGHNIGASDESGEPTHCPLGGEQSVWWTWTAPRDGNASVTTVGSSFDTVLAVYVGTAVDALTLVRCNDDESFPVLRTSKLTFPATVGTTYRIAVDGVQLRDVSDTPLATDAGLISLLISLDGESRLSDLRRREDGHYQFLLKGDSGRRYLIEAAPEVDSWTTIGEASLTGVAAQFVDITGTNFPRRFYRARPAPLTQ